MRQDLATSVSTYNIKLPHEAFRSRRLLADFAVPVMGRRGLTFDVANLTLSIHSQPLMNVRRVSCLFDIPKNTTCHFLDAQTPRAGDKRVGRAMVHCISVYLCGRYSRDGTEMN